MVKSEKFDLVDFTPYLLAQAAEQASQDFQRHYKQKYGMLRTEWRVVFHLGRYGGLTAKQICEMARIHKTKISRAVAALEQKRFLTRWQMDSDKRHERLELTRAGEKVFNDLYKRAQAFDENQLAAFTPKEREILRNCLMKIAKI